MTRFFYAFYRAFSGARYRLGRRLTPAGVFVAGMVAATAAAGGDLERTVAHQALFWLAALLVVAALWLPFFRGRFAVERVLPRCGCVDEVLRYPVRLTNHSGRTQRTLTLLETLADPRLSLAEFAQLLRPTERTRTFRLRRDPPARRHIALSEGLLPTLHAGERGEAMIEFRPRRRGILRFLGVAVCRTDPLGLMRSFIHVPAPQSLTILPRRYPLPSLGLPGQPRHQPGGVSLASSVGASDEFASLREYRHGDPWRHLHWRSWARFGRPIVKEYQDEWFARHALVLDTLTAPDNDAVFEEAVSVAASLVCAVHQQESLLDLMLVGPRAYRFTAGRGLAHTEQMMEVLAAVAPTPDAPWTSLRDLVLEHATTLSSVIAIWLTWDAARQDLVRGLLALRIPVTVLVVMDAHADAPQDLGPMAARPEHFGVVRVGTVAQDLRRWAERQHAGGGTES